jgi:hypothetical protein
MSEWYEQLLELQLRENRDIWARLGERGLGDGTHLRLGFVYLSPGEAEARRVVTYLEQETDYELDARPRGDDEDGEAGEWVVIGTTNPTPVSLDLLDDWVDWMIAAGAAAGPCAFDGWAAQIVEQ